MEAYPAEAGRDGLYQVSAAWITVTVADSGYRKRVRADAIISYGTLKDMGTFIDIAGRSILVSESEAEIAQLVGDMD